MNQKYRRNQQSFPFSERDGLLSLADLVKSFKDPMIMFENNFEPPRPISSLEIFPSLPNLPEVPSKDLHSTEKETCYSCKFKARDYLSLESSCFKRVKVKYIAHHVSDVLEDDPQSSPLDASLKGFRIATDLLPSSRTSNHYRKMNNLSETNPAGISDMCKAGISLILADLGYWNYEKQALDTLCDIVIDRMTNVASKLHSKLEQSSLEALNGSDTDSLLISTLASSYVEIQDSGNMNINNPLSSETFLSELASFAQKERESAGKSEEILKSCDSLKEYGLSRIRKKRNSSNSSTE